MSTLGGFVAGAAIVGVLGAGVTYLDRPSIEDLVLEEAPCVVHALGTYGTDAGLDQLEENARGLEGARIARDGDYLAIVSVECLDRMEGS